MNLQLNYQKSWNLKVKEVNNMFIVIKNNFDKVHVKCPYCKQHDGLLSDKIKMGTMSLSKCTCCNNLYEIKKEKPTVYSVLKYKI